MRREAVKPGWEASGDGPPIAPGVHLTRAVWGYLYWGGVWLLIGFLAAELAGLYRLAPWPTFSQTVWRAERYPYVTLFVFATLLTLIVHFLYRRPLWASAMFGLAVAIAAHLLSKQWP